MWQPSGSPSFALKKADALVAWSRVALERWGYTRVALAWVTCWDPGKPWGSRVTQRSESPSAASGNKWGEQPSGNNYLAMRKG